ncbi:MAG: cytochrome c oxidase subunit II [Anaerolineales bacterium]
MKRDLIYAAVLWLLLTAAGEFAALNIDYFPVGIAQEATIIDDAFLLLMVLGVPVFTFVVVGLLYAVIRFRSEDKAGDGPPIHTNKPLAWGWFVVTSGLAVFVIFNPGIKGMRELLADQQEDLVVEVTGSQWQWDYSYPDYDIAVVDADELVLPVDRRVKFEVSSTDVIHSFWVPAFRMKIDAVPGQINEMYVTPDETGSFSEDGGIRVQCAELCGTGHTRMRTGVRVVSQQEFEAWVEQNR